MVVSSVDVEVRSMPRAPRIQYENAFYHVMNRGRGRRWIFHGDNYYQAFLTCLEESHDRFDARIHAYCLMGNHYHLLIETPLANLDRIMRHINGVYTQRYNRLKNPYAKRRGLSLPQRGSVCLAVRDRQELTHSIALITAQVGAAPIILPSCPDTEHKPGFFPYPIPLYLRNILWSKNDCPNTASASVPYTFVVPGLRFFPSQFLRSQTPIVLVVSTLRCARDRPEYSIQRFRTFSALKRLLYNFQLPVSPHLAISCNGTSGSKPHDNDSAISCVITS